MNTEYPHTAKVCKEKKRQGSCSLFLLSFIGITFVSLQKNSAYTLECRLLEGKCSGKQAMMQGRTSGGDTTQEVGELVLGHAWVKWGKEGSATYRYHSPERSAF